MCTFDMFNITWVMCLYIYITWRLTKFIINFNQIYMYIFRDINDECKWYVSYCWHYTLLSSCCWNIDIITKCEMWTATVYIHTHRHLHTHKHMHTHTHTWTVFIVNTSKRMLAYSRPQYHNILFMRTMGLTR